jgi:predicted Zn-dependent protease
MGVTLSMLGIVAIFLLPAASLGAPPATRPQAESESGRRAQPESSINAEAELKEGTELTRRGLLQEAIPHLLAAQKSGLSNYATSFNLGICYLGTRQYEQAITTLEALRSSLTKTAAVNNLLAQAYIGDGQPQRAFEAFQKAAAETPADATLYAYVADACTEHQAYELGLRVVEQGLQQLAGSARLHYERAVFLARLDRLEEARPEFERAAALAPDSYISYLALVQKYLYDGNLPEANRLLHQGIQAGHRDYQMLSLLGTVLMHEGVAPGQPGFAEARDALEEAARLRPDFSATEIALGKLYLMEGRVNEAVDRLEAGRRMEPNNPAIYSSLAQAYLKLGDRIKAKQCQAELSRLLDAQDKSKAAR